MTIELANFPDFLDQLLGVSAGVKRPGPELPPVIDRTDPSPCRLMLGPVHLALFALDFEQQGLTIGEANKEVRKIGVGDAEVLVRNR